MGGMFGGGYAGPKEVQYMFIDAEQLRCTAVDVGESWFGKPIDIDYRALQADRQKVFYYDCLPARPDRADHDAAVAADYEARRSAKLQFFNELRRLPGWHVSEGLAKHRRKERQQQKEVDILIAVDMLTHTHRKNMHRLTFVSGDQDFAPLLEAVVRDGMYVELLYPEGHVADDLMYFADVARPMDVDFLHAFSTEAFKRLNGLPYISNELNSVPANGVWAGECLHAGVSYAKVWRETPDNMFNITTVQPRVGSNHYTSVRDKDEARAKRYFTMRMQRDHGLDGPLEWFKRP